MFKYKININQLLAVFVSISVFICYCSIIAPSVSFWDCGEYIAAGSTLGILHPPGNPLYVIFAKIASILFFFINNPALRINLLSALFGAMTSYFIYLTIVRVLVDITGDTKNGIIQSSIYIGAIVGALFSAFANTVVFSAVEAEVYVPLLLPISICTWLTVKWGQSKSPKRDNLLIIILLICFLGIGIHIYTMIVTPAILLYVIIKDPHKRKDWRFLFTTISMGVVMYQLSLYIFIGIGLISVTFIFLLFSKKNRNQWKFCFYLSIAAYLGFSVHFIIPIRASMNPTINMNHPATMKSFMDYLDRKQYGNESMINRMFWRRGQWKNQFGIEGHIGFGGFFLTQFFRIDTNDTTKSFFKGTKLRIFIKLIIYLIPLGFMLYGLFSLFIKSRYLAILLIILTLSSSLLMVVYMNFSDGTRPEYIQYQNWKNQGMSGPLPKARREVRVRDYFYIVCFMFYGMWIGISAGILLLTLSKSKIKIFQCIYPYAAIIVLISPLIPMSQNLPYNSRRGDLIPYNYAWNLLMSCEKNAILFTYGDNETYPLWALQETFSIRSDVRVVNVNLLNTSWYIRQCKNNEPRVPISFSDKEIENLSPELNPFNKDTNYVLPSAKIPVQIPGKVNKPILFLYNKLVIHIIDSNKWKKPIYFTVSVPDDVFMGLQPYLKQEGMVYRVTHSIHSADNKFDTMKTEFFLDTLYKLNDFPKKRMEVDEASARATNIFSVLFLKCAADRLQKAYSCKQGIDLYIEVRAEKNPDNTKKYNYENYKQDIENMKKNISKGIMHLDNRKRLFSEFKFSKELRMHLSQLQKYIEKVELIINRSI